MSLLSRGCGKQGDRERDCVVLKVPLEVVTVIIGCQVYVGVVVSFSCIYIVGSRGISRRDEVESKQIGRKLSKVLQQRLAHWSEWQANESPKFYLYYVKKYCSTEETYGKSNS